MPLLRVPQQFFVAHVDQLNRGGYVPMPRSACLLHSGLPRRDQHHQEEDRHGAYYTLVHICRQPARLSEIMAVRPDEGAMVRRVTRGASDVAGTGADTMLGAREVRQ